MGSPMVFLLDGIAVAVVLAWERIIYELAVEGFNGGRLLVYGRGTYSEH